MKASTIRLMITLVVLIVSGAPLMSTASAAERARPFRIGALTESWGPTAGIVGLRDGLLALGYREHEQFDIGVRFTQGDISALPAAARQLVQYGVDLIFAAGDASAKAAQRSGTRARTTATSHRASGARRCASWTRNSSRPFKRT